VGRAVADALSLVEKAHKNTLITANGRNRERHGAPAVAMTADHLCRTSDDGNFLNYYF
jgi:hypothetical protein